MATCRAARPAVRTPLKHFVNSAVGVIHLRNDNIDVMTVTQGNIFSNSRLVISVDTDGQNIFTAEGNGGFCEIDGNGNFDCSGAKSAVVPEAVTILKPGGDLNENNRSLSVTLNELAWWTRTLKVGREQLVAETR